MIQISCLCRRQFDDGIAHPCAIPSFVAIPIPLLAPVINAILFE